MSHYEYERVERLMTVRWLQPILTHASSSTPHDDMKRSPSKDLIILCVPIIHLDRSGSIVLFHFTFDSTVNHVKHEMNTEIEFCFILHLTVQ